MKELVEDFFSKNFRDITARNDRVGAGHQRERRQFFDPLQVSGQDLGQRHQDHEPGFTFDPKGNFVSVKNVEGYPTDSEGNPDKATGDAGRSK